VRHSLLVKQVFIQVADDGYAVRFRKLVAEKPTEAGAADLAGAAGQEDLHRVGSDEMSFGAARSACADSSIVT
jgi:hypothetical protein